MICFLSSFFSWRTIGWRRSSLVITQNCFGLASGQALDRLLDHGLLAVQREQLLGARLRLSGQKRVPRPPARMTG